MMERRFDMSDFEQSLKDHADQFNLAPSKRVWRGIYNNLYPGRKWPSITVAIVFIITLFTIGHLNNSPKQEETSQLSKSVQNENIHQNIALSNAGKNSDEPTGADEASAANLNYPNSSLHKKGLLKNSVALDQPATQAANEKNSVTSKQRSLAPHAITTGTTGPTNLFSNSNDILTQDHAIVRNYDLSIDEMNRTDFVMNENLRKYVEGNRIFSNNGYDVASNAGNSIMSKPIFSFARFVPDELSLVDNNSLFANAITLKEPDKNSLLNNIRKKIKSAKWMYYLTPSLSSASFINRGAHGIRSNFSLLQNRSGNGMMYKAGLGLEAGAQANYRFSAKWDFITGANIRYSGYNVVSNLVHPTFASLSFRDNNVDYSKSYITHFGNGMTQNQINLLNYSVQASVPVGLQYHIWQDKNVQINLLSAVDVSAVLKSNAYIISSDGRYYVKDPSLSRPVNMGINFNPNIVLSGKKIKWHLGPSIRYQLFSRYKNNYQAKEHLIDYGIRIGISK